MLCQAHATKQNYILAMKQLSKVGFVSLVQLMLAVPAERKGKDPLVRQVTSDYRTPARPDHAGIDWSGGPWANGWPNPHSNSLFSRISSEVIAVHSATLRFGLFLRKLCSI
ncbi:MAG: hypothetical protein PHT52_06930 [Eubacteriales bacterium]|nr:hypothetical protein [Eubacteriales bacterium]